MGDHGVGDKLRMDPVVKERKLKKGLRYIETPHDLLRDEIIAIHRLFIRNGGSFPGIGKLPFTRSIDLLDRLMTEFLRKNSSGEFSDFVDISKPLFISQFRDQIRFVLGEKLLLFINQSFDRPFYNKEKNQCLQRIYVDFEHSAMKYGSCFSIVLFGITEEEAVNAKKVLSELGKYILSILHSQFGEVAPSTNQVKAISDVSVSTGDIKTIDEEDFIANFLVTFNYDKFKVKLEIELQESDNTRNRYHFPYRQQVFGQLIDGLNKAFE